MIFGVAWAVMAILTAALSFLTVYLLVLTIAAIFARTSGPAAGCAQRRFAILIPAHNEEALIGRLLASVKQLHYPAERYDVCVVADNCDDSTADIARSMGAAVWERTDTRDRAKGFALRWLLEQLRCEGKQYDAFVVLDADSTIAANFLTCMNARLEHGSQVVQAYYSVTNATDSAVTGLRYAALAAIHYVRPLGRSLLGLSCGLKGNGMCFSTAVVERFGWNWFTLAEDVEFHLALVRAGIRVDFAPETSVQAEMPVTLAQAASQNARWEQGRLQLVRQYVPGLLLSGIRSADTVQLDAAVEQLIPPLSLPFALAAACVLACLPIGAIELAIVALLNLVGQMAYLLTGLVLVGAPRGAYTALGAAPVYILWKIGLYARAMLSNRAGAWVRTARVVGDVQR